MELPKSFPRLTCDFGTSVANPFPDGLASPYSPNFVWKKILELPVVVPCFHSRNCPPWPRLVIGVLFLAAVTHVRSTAQKTEQRINEFELRDIAGKAHTTSDWKDSKAVVLFFLGLECPVSNGYAPEMSRLAAQYGKRGVVFWAVNADPDVTPAEAARHARDYKVDFPVLLDPEHQLAGPAGVRTVPEAVVLESTGKIRYRGRIDDRYTERGKRREVVTAKDLEQALEAVLDGKEVPRPITRGYGCPLPNPSKKLK